MSRRTFIKPIYIPGLFSALVFLLCCTLQAPVYAAAITYISVKQANGLELYLHAVGAHEENDKLLYMAAVYATRSNHTLEAGNPMRMEMRINTDDFSANQFTRIWLDAFALNTSAEQRRRLQGDMTYFHNLYSNDFRPGDRLAFDYVAADGRTDFYLNNKRLGSISGIALFDVLLQAWVGPAPIHAPMTSALLDSLANRVPESELRRFRLIPLESRPEGTTITL